MMHRAARLVEPLKNIKAISHKENLSFPSPPPPPALVGEHPLDARVINLHDDLLCNDTCSVVGGGGVQSVRKRAQPGSIQANTRKNIRGASGVDVMSTATR